MRDDQAPIERSAEHASFTIERMFDAPPERVFHAFANAEAKARWFHGAGEWTLLRSEFDFRVGGREHLSGRWASGMVSAFDCRYEDIVPDQRIVYSYAMELDGRRISVSLGTFEFRPDGNRTQMRYTEQAVYLDGHDDAGRRERGTIALFEQLAASLHDCTTDPRAHFHPEETA